MTPTILDVQAREVRPFDMLDEGRWVRQVTLHPLGDGPGVPAERAVFVSLMVASCSIGEAGGARWAAWGIADRITFDSPDTIVRVVRGLAPPDTSTQAP